MLAAEEEVQYASRGRSEALRDDAVHGVHAHHLHHPLQVESEGGGGLADAGGEPGLVVDEQVEVLLQLQPRLLLLHLALAARAPPRTTSTSGGGGGGGGLLLVGEDRDDVLHEVVELESRGGGVVGGALVGGSSGEDGLHHVGSQGVELAHQHLQAPGVAEDADELLVVDAPQDLLVRHVLRGTRVAGAACVHASFLGGRPVLVAVRRGRRRVLVGEGQRKARGHRRRLRGRRCLA
mmetsp:Transcript_778/g.1374  ORF Transcript_778/g.1374 Transcript_778/m.1374 type:complete len:236 (+) Transcript_778:572-1279(+)